MKKIAIVTGASSGMGRDFVSELLKEKSVEEIWIIARRRERLEAMSHKFHGGLRVLSMDLTQMSSFEKLEAVLALEKPEISYLVNAAGAGYMGKIKDIDYHKHAFLLDINVRALTCMTCICLPYMEKGSHVIELCSGSAFLPQPGFASYAASKAYVLSFTRALRQEVKSKGISVTAVCPGPVKTEFFKAAGSKVHPSKKRFMAESKDVVKKAMRDAKSGRELSIYGTSMKLVHLSGKILSTRVALAVMNKMLTEKGSKANEKRK